MNVAGLLKVKGDDVATALTHTTLQNVAQQLATRKIGAIIVLDDDERVVGIMSERDIVRLIAQSGADVLQTAVGDVMTRDPISCDLTMTIDEVMAMMTRGRFRHLPVVEGGGLIGIISIGDVVKHHMAEVEMEVTAMRGYLATG